MLSERTRTARTSAAIDEVQEHQVWFGPAERPLFGWLTLPAGGTARAGVVLCSPMGEEGRASHRTFRRLALALAEAGMVALRFDYDGTGDSAGAQHDPDRVPSWMASIDRARDLLRAVVGGQAPISAVGMRLGATLAAAVAASGEPFDDLVLWDPCASGRGFLREGEALYAFGEDAEHASSAREGLRLTPGFQYDEATALGLRSLSLAALPAGDLAARVVLFAREDRPVASAALKRLRAEGEALVERVALDQDQLLDVAPSDCHVPERTLREIVTTLAEGVADRTPCALVAHPTTGPAAVAAGVVESSRWWGQRGLYGIVTEPAQGEVSDRPWVVFVNVAIEHHIGPGRRWVEFARSWAQAGYRCVRIDQTGVGDSPTPAGRPDDLAFSPDWMEDLASAVGELRADGAPVVMVGLCSGAYSAFETALRVPVEGIVAINPRLTLYPAAADTEVFTRDRLAGVVPALPIARLAHRRRILAGALWRLYRQIAVWHAPYTRLGRVLRSGTQVSLTACRDDAQHFWEVAFWWPALTWRRRTPRLEFDCNDRMDHSLLTLDAQLEAERIAVRFLTTRFPVQP